MPRNLMTGKQVFSQRKIPQTNKQEPTYETDEDLVPVREQKWKIPKSDMERAILSAARPLSNKPRYTSHEEKTAVLKIVRGSISLTSGLISTYPTEWVEFCIAFCEKLWHDHRPMSLQNLIKYINNTEKMNDWVAQWASKNHVSLSVQGKDNG